MYGIPHTVQYRYLVPDEWGANGRSWSIGIILGMFPAVIKPVNPDYRIKSANVNYVTVTTAAAHEHHRKAFPTGTPDHMMFLDMTI